MATARLFASTGAGAALGVGVGDWGRATAFGLLAWGVSPVAARILAGINAAVWRHHPTFNVTGDRLRYRALPPPRLARHGLAAVAVDPENTPPSCGRPPLSTSRPSGQTTGDQQVPDGGRQLLEQVVEPDAFANV